MIHLDYLIVVTPLTKKCFPTLIELLKPVNKMSESRFELKQAYVAKDSIEKGQLMVLQFDRTDAIQDMDLENEEEYSNLSKDSNDEAGECEEEENSDLPNARL